MDSIGALAEAQGAGLTGCADGERLAVRGPESAEPLALALLERKADVLPIPAAGAANLTDVSKSPADRDDAEVAWRIATMRPQLARRGSIPFLVARPDVPTRDGYCWSCDDEISQDRRYRCAPCVHAAEQVLRQVREGVAP